jgi:type IV pilus assembly protein PilP
MRRLLFLTSGLILFGCGADLQEIDRWMAAEERKLPRSIEPLPQVKPFTPFVYAGTDLPEPFKPRKLSTNAPTVCKSCGIQTSQTRRREPLEAYSIEQLKMVGTLQRGKEMIALVRAERSIFQVRKGNYLGQNYGLITDVLEGEIKIKEIVPDSQGELVEREGSLQLIEDTKELKK